MCASSEIEHLHQLAHVCGVQTEYYDVSGNRRQASMDALFAVLQSLGAPAASLADVPQALRERRQALWNRMVEPVSVVWDDEEPRVDIRLRSEMAGASLTATLMLETGEQQQWEWQIDGLPTVEATEVEGASWTVRRLTLPQSLPRGYHRLAIEVKGRLAETMVISAPRKAYSLSAAQACSWGVFLPLYALYSKRSWGSGDFSDLEALIEWVSGKGGGVVATLPLLASFLDETFSPSPYTPASRLMWNEFYLDIARVPELQGCPEAQDLIASYSFRSELEAVRKLAMVDYRRQMALKRAVLEQLCLSCFSEAGSRLEALHRFVDSSPRVEDYARFRAASDKYRTLWQGWPQSLRDGKPKKGDYNEDARRYHLYVQWLAAEQVEALSQAARAKNVRLYLDLPLGVHPAGYDIWRNQSLFVPEVSAGAPPDTFFRQGQNWGFLPIHPERQREQGYRYYIDCLRHHLRHASVLRLDHVMSLHRLFWIPDGMEASEGVYVSYPAEEFYAILSIESHRNKAVIIGEDLGTVPAEVRPAMERHGLHRTYVVQYESNADPQNALRPVGTDMVASLNTHDMPTFAAFWQGTDIEERLRLGFLDEAGAQEEREKRRAIKAALVEFLRLNGLANSALEMQDVLSAILRFLNRSPASNLVVNLEDLWLETESQNMPGTREEHPNWRKKARHSFETFSHMPQVIDILDMVDKERKQGMSGGAERKGGMMEQLPRDTTQGVRYDITLLTDDDLYLFNEGSHYRLYQKLGAHPLVAGDVPGTYFAVWAPNAEYVSVIGEFNGWNRDSHPLRPRGQSGIWEGFVSGLSGGALYKYYIVSRYNGYRVEKTDPFAFYNETPSKTASIVRELDYTWHDGEWMERRKQRNSLNSPIAIYEVHLGSWRRVPEEDNRPLTYREMAHWLADYIQDMGFTHVELLPVMEHPFYGSWGYQTTGYFAPTSRYGTPQDFMYLIDHLHQHGIGVILDWVPSHFPSDEHGLGYFDGTHIYEHSDPRKGIHPDWNSCIFNYGRHEVCSFLISSALFWLDHYHVDSLRLDAVASMLYLDYARKEGEWVPNQYGGRENLEAIDFLRRLNEAVYVNYSDVQTIAEESTAWPMVSRPTYVGGLGFGMKWDMGWMHDTLRYMTKDSVYRKYHHSDLTFRMVYAFHENFILPLSHDEVVHGKGSLLGKMPGDDWQKFANLRLLFGYMYAQPGKKLLFMGGELGQWGEWDHEESLEWHLLGYSKHQALQNWVKDLNAVYSREPALHAADCDPLGFEWIDCSDADNSIISLLRKGGSKDDVILVVGNFTPVPRLNYRVGAPRGGVWKEILNSDAKEYGGVGYGNLGALEASSVPHHNRPYCLNLTLPPLGILFFKSEGRQG